MKDLLLLNMIRAR